MDFDENVKKLGIKYQTPYEDNEYFVAYKEFGNKMLSVSGTGADHDDFYPQGSVGKDFTVEEAYDMAYGAVINIVSGIKKKYGTLNVVKSIVKITVYVHCAEGFDQPGLVAHGASKAFVDIFGEEAGKPSRTALGMRTLPDGIPLEVDAFIELN